MEACRAVLINKQPTALEVFPVKDRIVIILGNGPSLTDYLSEIEGLAYNGAAIFGVNRIYLLDAPFRVHYFVALDKILWEMESHNIHKRMFARHFCPQRYIQFADLTRLVPFEFAGKPRNFAMNWGECLGHGYTSVYAAMQLAFMIRPSEIRIYGVDYSHGKDGKSHFWGTTKRKHATWQRGLESTLQGIEILKRKGITTTIRSHLFAGAGGKL